MKEFEDLGDLVSWKEARADGIIRYGEERNMGEIIEKYCKKLEKENERINNIINELEKWCLSWKENDKYCYLASNDKDKCRYDIWEEVLDKLQELKDSDKE